jgi:predicted metal-dependent HD superfamily phosphohydrolase
MTLPAPPPGLVIPAALAREIERAYSEPHRAYHDLTHLDELGARFHELLAEGAWTRPREVFLALLFHDAVYVPGAGDNEQTSAALARGAIARHLDGVPVDVERVASLVVATARHGTLAPGDVDDEAALFLDIDMAILAAPEARFDAYDRGVRREYAAVSDDDFARGRARFLRRLAGGRVFLTDRLEAALGPAARANAARALARLGSGGPAAPPLG